MSAVATKRLTEFASCAGCAAKLPPGRIGEVLALLMLFAVYGAARWARSPERLALVAFVIYIFATTQAVDAAQSRLRAPAEFAICLLAIAGWQALKRRARRHGG